MEHPHCGEAHGQFEKRIYTDDKEVVALLRVAFQRKLVLNIDNNNSIVWNIPHTYVQSVYSQYTIQQFGISHTSTDRPSIVSIQFNSLEYPTPVRIDRLQLVYNSIVWNIPHKYGQTVYSQYTIQQFVISHTSTYRPSIVSIQFNSLEYPTQVRINRLQLVYNSIVWNIPHKYVQTVFSQYTIRQFGISHTSTYRPSLVSIQFNSL